MGILIMSCYNPYINWVYVLPCYNPTIRCFGFLNHLSSSGPSNLSPHPRATAFARQLPLTPLRRKSICGWMDPGHNVASKHIKRPGNWDNIGKWPIFNRKIPSSFMVDVRASHVSFPRGVYDALKVACVPKKGAFWGESKKVVAK